MFTDIVPFLGEALQFIGAVRGKYNMKFLYNQELNSGEMVTV